MPFHSKIQAELLESIAQERNCSTEEVKAQLKNALLNLDPHLNGDSADSVVLDILSSVNFSNPDLAFWSLTKIAETFYKQNYLHAGWYY